MNLNITYSDEKYIQNFTNINILRKTYNEELDSIAGASCKTIIVSEAIQMLEFDSVKTVLSHILSKMRQNGKITLTVVDMDRVLNFYQSGQLDDATMSNIIKDIRSVMSIDFIVQSMLNVGILIESIEKKDFFVTIHGYRQRT